VLVLNQERLSPEQEMVQDLMTKCAASSVIYGGIGERGRHRRPLLAGVVYTTDAINILRAGHARCTCEASDAVISPAAGTHRGDYASRSAVGISGLRPGRMSKTRPCY